MATDSNNATISLRRLCHTEAAEMLGIWMSPSNNESTLINVLKTRAMEWGAKIRQGNSRHYEAWVTLHTNMTARLKYPVQASTLSQK